MKNIRTLVALFLLAVFLAGTAWANTSSINPNVPAQNSPLSSSVLRGNFGNAYTDENIIYGMMALSSNQLLGTVFAGNAGPLNIPSCSTGALGWVPSSGLVCNSITGLTSPVTQSLVFTGAHAINLNAASLPTPLLGTVVQVGNSDTIASRIENDAFGASAYFTGIRADGTAAARTTLQSGDEISGINAWGYNGTAAVGPKASVREYASQNWTTSANGTYVDIATALNGTTTMNQVVKFENDGGITVPGTVTGGDMGPGTINAAHVYKNGVELTPASTTLVEIGSVQTASNSATLQWTSLPTSTYNTFMLDCNGLVPATNNVSFQVQFGEGVTPTWEAGASYSYGVFLSTTQATTATAGTNGTNTSAFILGSSANISTTAGFSNSYTIKFYNLGVAGLYKNISFQVQQMYFNVSNWSAAGFGGGFYGGDTNAVTAIRVFFSSGNIASGQCSLYGYVP